MKLSTSLANLLLLGAAAAITAQESTEADDWSVYWKTGTRVESADGRFALKFGGRIQADFTFADPDAALASRFDFEDGGEFRRARLFFEGTLYDTVEFKAQYDFAGGEAEPKDVYLGLVDLPVVGGVRVGHFKEPFSLEEITSSKYLAFLERSSPIEAFAPVRNLGLMLHDGALDDRLTWAVGAFKDADDGGESLGGEWNLTARVTGLPVWRDDGEVLVHLGVGLSERSPVDDVARFRARPGNHLAPRLVDTGALATAEVRLVGLEAAAVVGPWWISSELVQASVESPADADLDGFYLQTGFFFTGESRAYKRSAGVFDRLTPARSFRGEGGGWGALEIALRYDDLDLADGAVTGGEQDSLAVALNWYLNPITRVMLNFVQADRTDLGTVDQVLVRFQIDF